MASSSNSGSVSSSSLSSSSPNPRPSSSNSHSLLCEHSSSAAATVDLIILILVHFSFCFLLYSHYSYLSKTISLLLAQPMPHLDQFPIAYLIGFFVFFTVSVLVIEFRCSARWRKCGKPGCKGLKKAMEFDLQLQTEEHVRSGSNEIDELPRKNGNPNYECLRSELRKMAPPNGRAVLLFRARCGCPTAKLEGWASKKGKRQYKSSPNAPTCGQEDSR